MTADSPLILSLDLQHASLSLTLFDLCGLSPLYTQAFTFAQANSLTPHSESIVSALDALLEQVNASAPSLFGRVRAIATTAVIDDAVFLTPAAPHILSTLSPYERLEPQLRHKLLSATTTQSNGQLLSAKTSPTGFSALSLQDILAVTASQTIQSFASHICKVSKTPLWDLCGHILPIGTFLDSLLIGQIAPCNPTQASSAGFLDSTASHWDLCVADSCCQGKGAELISKLPSICDLQYTQRLGSWLVQRFGFCSDCVVISSLPSLVTGYISFLPGMNDGGLKFGSSDNIIMPLQRRITTRPHHSMLVNPLHLLEKSSNKPWLAIIQLPSAGLARSNVRATYTNTWKAFNQLVQAVCPGGSIGLDNKLFSLYVPQGPHKGLRRFEHGTRVAEFFDLRANPRCVIEGQALHMRKTISQLNKQDRDILPAHTQEYRGAAGCLTFDPRDDTLMLPRWHSWGRAAGNERIAEVYSHILGAAMLADEAEVRACAQESEGHTPTMHQVTRSSWGACFLAAYLVEQGECFRTCIDSLKRRMAIVGPQRPPLLRAKSTLECVQEDEGDDTTFGEKRRPATRFRPRRSLTVCVQAVPSAIQSLGSRERSSSVNTPTSLPPSSCPEEASSMTSLRSSPREISTPTVDLTLPNTPVVSLISPVEKGGSVDNGRGVIQLGEPDKDLWQFYGATLEEYIRLSDMIEETLVTYQLPLY